MMEHYGYMGGGWLWAALITVLVLIMLVLLIRRSNP